MSVCPAKTQISLGIRPVWSESSLSAWRKLGSLATHWVHSEDSDQTGRMPRLILVFAGHTLTLLVLSCRGSDVFFMIYQLIQNWHFMCLEKKHTQKNPLQKIERLNKPFSWHHVYALCLNEDWNDYVNVITVLNTVQEFSITCFQGYSSFQDCFY